MHAAVVITSLLAAWVVEEAPVVPKEFNLVERTTVLDGQWVAVIATRAADPGTRVVFASSPGGIKKLGAYTDLIHNDDTGTLVLQREHDSGCEPLQIRTRPSPAIVSLGMFPEQVEAMSCDATTTKCALLFSNATLLLWTRAAKRVLFQHGKGEEDLWNPFSSVSLHPTGTHLGVSARASTLVFDLAASGPVTVFRGESMGNAPTLRKAIDALGDSESALSRRLEAGNEDCVSSPGAWNGNRLSVSHSGFVAVGAAPCKAVEFEFDVVKKVKTTPPPYPWSGIDCPLGGWSSSAGALVTTCADPTTSGESAKSEPLPEGVAMSPTQIFVMAPRRKTKWQWARGRARLEVVLNGPSVVTFHATGVIVEEVPGWRFRSAIFEAPMSDDWHLVSTNEGSRLVRLRQSDTATGR